MNLRVSLACVIRIGALLVAPILLLVVLSTRPPYAYSAVVLDDFNDNSLNTSIWQELTSGAGSTVVETNGRIEFAHDEARGDLGGGSAVLIGKCKLVGDFDIQVDFDLLEWPAQNAARFTLFASPLFTMERISADVEYYFASFGANPTLIPTTDMTGSLRIQREGDTVTASYLEGTDWVTAATRSGVSTADVTFNIQSVVEAIPNPETIVAAADNAVINAGTAACHRNGDVDCSTRVTHFDALDAVLAAAGVTNAWPGCPAIGSGAAQPASGEGPAGPSVFGDVNCDGTADVDDLLPILRFVAGFPTGLPGSCTPIGDFIVITY